jgi:hypothetical protein
MVVSLTTPTHELSSYPMVSTFVCRVPIPPSRMVEQNVSSALLTTSSVPYSFKLTFLLPIGLRLFTSPHTFSISTPPAPSITPLPILHSLVAPHLMTISVSLAVSAIPTSLPLPPINSLPAPPCVSSLVTRLNTKATAVLISPPIVSSSPATLCSTNPPFRSPRPLPARLFPLTLIFWISFLNRSRFHPLAHCPRPLLGSAPAPYHLDRSSRLPNRPPGQLSRLAHSTDRRSLHLGRFSRLPIRPPGHLSCLAPSTDSRSLHLGLPRLGRQLPRGRRLGLSCLGYRLHLGRARPPSCILRARATAFLGVGALPTGTDLLVIRLLRHHLYLWAPFQLFLWSTATACALARKAVFASRASTCKLRLLLSPLYHRRTVAPSTTPSGGVRWRTSSKPSSPTTLGLSFHARLMPTSSKASGYSNTSFTPMVPLSATKRVGSFVDLLSALASILTRLLVPL